VPSKNTLQHDRFQKQVTDLCDEMELPWFHNPDSRRVRAGLTDLIIIGPGGVIFAEIKTGTGKLNPSQREIIHLLRQSHQLVYVWRPGNLKNGDIHLALTAIKKPLDQVPGA
jgi:hypothetical protein